MSNKKHSSIADKLVVEKVEIKIDGKVWPVVVTHNVIIDAEEAMGSNGNLLSGETNLAKPSFKTTRALLYAVLKRSGAKYTLDEVGDLITPHNLVKIQEAILTSWAASMPELEPVEEIESPNVQAGNA